MARTASQKENSRPAVTKKQKAKRSGPEGDGVFVYSPNGGRYLSGTADLLKLRDEPVFGSISTMAGRLDAVVTQVKAYIPDPRSTEGQTGKRPRQPLQDQTNLHEVPNSSPQSEQVTMQGPAKRFKQSIDDGQVLLQSTPLVSGARTQSDSQMPAIGQQMQLNGISQPQSLYKTNMRNLEASHLHNGYEAMVGGHIQPHDASCHYQPPALHSFQADRVRSMHPSTSPHASLQPGVFGHGLDPQQAHQRAPHTGHGCTFANAFSAAPHVAMWLSGMEAGHYQRL